MIDVHFIYPGKLQNACEYFNLSSQKEGFEVTIHAFRPENIHKIYHDMDNSEQRFIETLISKGDPVTIVNSHDVNILKLTNHLGFVYQLNEDEFFVNNFFLRYINSEVLDNAYGEFESLDTINHMNLNEEVFRVRQHTRLNDVTLEQALLLKTNNELKSICRQYGIKGFSNKNKQHLVELIMAAFFNNNHIIEQVFSSATLFEFDILSSILESDANYRLNNELIEFEKLQLINFDNFLTSHFYYYYDFEYDCLILPNDVRKHIETFVNQVGNGDIKKAVNQFVNEQTIENSLSEFENALKLSMMDDEVDLDMLIENDDFEDFGTTDSLRNDAITQLISEIKKGLIDKKDILPLRIILGSVNLYGILSTNHLLYLLQRFYDATFSKEELQYSLDTLAGTELYYIEDDFVFHPVLFDVVESEASGIDISEEGYYVPASVEELIYYDRHHYLKSDKAIKEFTSYLRKQINMANDIEKEKYVNEIIMLLRTIPTPELIQPIMQLFIDNAILNNVQNDALLIEKATLARNHLRLWSLQGHRDIPN
ncbi:TPA: hypothetical protein RRM88_001271 [Staphylococcus argenteus]|uniref:hypothetical protein n=1 Tax=Staphylococcus argenteus TaxID=985002 RepID=UPI000507329E|nr:hypothetical protein [Staphylococcus argenteus]MBE2136030.1 hypothetical protein [Staphylococcus argenteus]MDT3004766.1 hypothetical protein [Staphylococcus argenteus]UPO21177.1 hypothetical protein M0D62_01870 [Staphylococcus argenteus]CDR64733.1 hypothetical protein ERS154949_02091 [Staphylococcus argenteus]HDY9445879.1 hypothetical protein [Staphylococcus argenteus]